MSKLIRDAIIKSGQENNSSKTPKLLEKFNFKTQKKNQFIAFFKPEVFFNKELVHLEKIVDLVFDKFAQYEVSVDGAALYSGPSLENFSIMDRHYGVINHLSKNASKVLTLQERKKIHEALKITDRELKILGGHEAFPISDIKETSIFDKYWLKMASTRIRGGFYVRPMTISNEEVIVVNGFHPHQLAHYNGVGRKLAVMIITSNLPWKVIREEMLGDAFPEKAAQNSIRGTLYREAKEHGFESVTIANNILHISAGPTEALFEMNNFLSEPFGVDIFNSGAKLAAELLNAGLTKAEIRQFMTDKELHGELEHKDTPEAVDHIISKRPNNRQV